MPLVDADGYQVELGHDLPQIATPALQRLRDGFLGRLFYMVVEVARERLAAAWQDPETQRMVIRWAIGFCRRRARHVATGAALAYVGNEVLSITYEGDEEIQE